MSQGMEPPPDLEKQGDGFFPRASRKEHSLLDTLILD
jgi:hypothetical protein